MKAIYVLALVALALACASAMPTEKKANHIGAFEAFKAKYGRKYATVAEESKRLRVFVQNMKKAEKLSAANPLATFGANEFADMSAAEFKVRHSGEKHFKAQAAKRKPVANLFTADQVRAAASSIDWRAQGAVTYVKNQGQCGSCWSFSATGSIEGQWFLAGNTLVAVSEQELVSCDTVDSGCNGGLMDDAWGWLISAEGGAIVTEASYPYVSGGGSVPACSMAGTTVGSTISGNIDLPQSESQMATWMTTNGPISIGVDATSWQTYTGGIMTNCISSQVDHGVLAVGFDDTTSPPYWIVKNSWGASWGESGFIRIQKGTDQCLITSGPCSSQVASGPQPPTPPPGPPTPSPPTPPTPSGGDFTQYTCEDFFCTEGCQAAKFPQNTCLQTTGGGSVIAVCSSAGLALTSFTTTTCTGPSSSSVEPVDECLADTSGTYIYNVCSGGSSSGGPAPSSSGGPAPSSSGGPAPSSSGVAPSSSGVAPSSSGVAPSASSSFDAVPTKKFQLPKSLADKLKAARAKKH